MSASATAVDADLVGEDALADEASWSPSGRRRRPPSRDPRSVSATPASRLDLVGGGLALVLAGDAARPAGARWRGGLDGGVHVVLVVEEDRELLVGFAALAASSAWASHSALMNGLAASRPSATTSSVGAWSCPRRTRSHVSSVASASTIMMATSPSASDAAGDDHVEDRRSICSTVGKPTHWSSIRATRTPPMGPENGRPASCGRRDAALIASTSYGRWGSAPGR
jgi:hypothetical protein